MQLTKKCPKYTYRKDGVYYFSNALSKGLLDPCLIWSDHPIRGVLKAHRSSWLSPAIWQRQ